MMRAMDLSAHRGRGRPPRTSDRRHDHPIAPNLLDRRFAVDRSGIKPSTSQRGNGLDHAPRESVLASLKKEHVHHARFRPREAAKAAVLDDVGVFSNRQRRHLALGYPAPAGAPADMEGIGRLVTA
jgi:transposase InsO family protein